MQSQPNNSPLVSIILPTYNREKLIKRSIVTVLNQTYQNYELLVIDDASTDGTSEIVKAFDDSRIRYVRLEENSGAGAARNYGIKIARADFIAFQDSDDEWMPDKLEKHMQVFREKENKCGVVYSDMQKVFPDGSSEYYNSPQIILGQILNPETQFYQVYRLGIQSTVIRKECFEKLGLFLEEITCLQDMELFIRLAKHYEFYHIQEPLVKYCQTEGLTSHFFYQLRDRKKMLKMYSAELKYNKKFIIREYFEINGRLFSRRSRAFLEGFLNKVLALFGIKFTRTAEA